MYLPLEVWINIIKYLKKPRQRSWLRRTNKYLRNCVDFYEGNARICQECDFLVPHIQKKNCDITNKHLFKKNKKIKIYY